MNSIHENSSITPHPDFDLFAIPPTQLTVDKDIFTEHRPISILSSNSVIQFVIPTAIDEYIQLRESLLYIKLKIDIKKTGTGNVTEDDWKKIAPVNYLLHSLFRQIDLEIDGKSVTFSPQTYPYKAIFETILGFTNDAKSSYLTAAGYYDDTMQKNAFTEEVSKLIRPDTISSDGQGKSIELMGKMHLDLAFQPRALLGGNTIKLTLVPNDPKFYLLLKDDTIKPTVTFENTSIYVHRSKVNYPIVEAHNNALLKGTAKYPICRSHVRSFNINSSVSDVTIDNAISGQLPRRIFVALVPNDAFSGNYLKNPYNFKNCNLNYIAVYVDGIQYPSKAYKPDFTNNLYVREYIGLFESLNQITTDSVINLDMKKWGNGNTIFGFNFAPDLSDDCNKMGYANLIKKGTLRIELKFANALTETINVLMYCEFDNMIEIDQNRQVFTDYM